MSAAEAAQQLEAILEDSAASMQAQHSAAAAGASVGAGGAGEGSSSGSSKAAKTAWWRARLGLDERLRCLLEGLDSRCLAPWMCASPHCPSVHAPQIVPTNNLFHFLLPRAATSSCGSHCAIMQPQAGSTHIKTGVSPAAGACSWASLLWTMLVQRLMRQPPARNSASCAVQRPRRAAAALRRRASFCDRCCWVRPA